ncbi:hypothetical protein SKC41_12245 [Mycobacterium sp. 050128]|uniref:hypothetical protein n=1 Tax=Mycobacterium sp. 050128 TaxID=3096112 RepID=UPI002ED8473B
MLLTIFGLTSLAPWSWIGWWKLVGGTTSNVWLGQTGQTGLWWQIAAFAIPLCLLFVVPMLAHAEEATFRLGSEKRSIPARLRRQLLFGFMHCALAGVPLAAGPALMLSGFYFERVYLKALQRLKPEIEAAKHIPEFVRTPYPEYPSGPGYDAAAWDKRRREAEAVAESNHHRLDEWLQERPGRAQEAARRVEELKERALVKAAAAHAVSNTVVIAALLAFLVVGQLWP